MYMAPEFFVGENPSYGRSVDVFAMGMLYLCMLQAQQGKPLLSPKTGTARADSLREGRVRHQCLGKLLLTVSMHSTSRTVVVRVVW